MEHTALGNSEIQVSRLCFGCGPLGGHDFGKVDQKEVCAAVAEAVESGVNFFDTSDIYGLGRAETLLGQTLGGRRKKVVIASKFGVRRSSDGKIFYDNSPAWIEQSLTESLARLSTDYIDVYQIHHLDDRTPLADVLESLEREVDRGRIRGIGLTNIRSTDLHGLELSKSVLSFQLEFSLAVRKEEATIEALREKGLSFLSYGSLGQGILSGKYDRSSTFGRDDRRSRSAYVNFFGEALEKNLLIVEAMRGMSSACRKTVPQIAVRWILDRFPNSVTIVGIKDVAQLSENVGALNWNLKANDFRRLDELSSRPD